LDQAVHEGSKDLLVHRELLAQKDHQDLLDRQDQREQLALLVMMDLRERLDHPVLPDHLGHEDKLVKRESKVPEAIREKTEILVYLVTRVPLDKQVHQVRLGQRDSGDHQDPPELMA
jgi:hypothetical protein